MAADESSSSSCTLVDIAPPIPPHFHPVGRLDQHSHGLLLFSASGAFTSALLSPKSKVVRVYQLVVQGDVGSVGSETYRSIVDRIAKGVETDYGSFKGTVVKMQRDVEKEGYVHDQCVDGKGCRNDKYQTSGACKPAGGGGTCSVLSSVSIKVAEGKRRMVRRMFAAIDLFVLDLKRIKYGDIELESSLLPGEWRYVSTKLETDWCRAVLEHWKNGARGWDKEDD
jgi:16S rRNA pseudouridine516 synthase